MPTILDEILAHKRSEVELARAACPLEQLKSLPGYQLPRRSFYGAVTAPRQAGPNLIAEAKGSSPSAGRLRAEYDPVALARQYADGGAQALSVLTDERYFGGRLEHIAAIKAAVGLPVLRKDFLVDPYQVYESRAHEADAILVIADAMEVSAALELVALARSLELCVLLEIHTRERLLAVLEGVRERSRAGVLLGINNRDLHAQKVDLATTERLAPLVPLGWPIVAESGIKSRTDVQRMHLAGARALLVGETLLRSGDPVRTMRELLG